MREESNSPSRAMGEWQGDYLTWGELSPLTADQKEARYYLYRRRKGHTLEYCVTFRKILTINIRLERYYSMRVEQLGSTSCHFPSTRTKQRSDDDLPYRDEGLGRWNSRTWEGKPDLDCVVQQQNSLNLENSRIIWTLELHQCLAIVKAIIELAIHLGTQSFQRRPLRGNRFKDNPMVVYEKGRQVVPASINSTIDHHMC